MEIEKLNIDRRISSRVKKQMEKAQREYYLSEKIKAINEEFGHCAGDHVLQQIASSLTEYVRRNDIVSRWGGEEFLVIFSEIKLTAARIVAERLRGRLATTPQVEDGPEQITVSIGLAMLHKGVTADALIEQADQALYRAKARGRNRVEVAGEERRSMPSTSDKKGIELQGIEQPLTIYVNVDDMDEWFTELLSRQEPI